MFSIDDLKKSSTFFSEVLDNIDSAILVLDENLQAIFANKFFEHVFGKKEHILNQTCGNALGCIFAISGAGECGKMEYCNKCELREKLQKKATNRKNILKRKFVIKNRIINKVICYSVKDICFNNKKFKMLVIDDITRLENNKTRAERANSKLKILNRQLQIVSTIISKEANSRVELEKKNAVLSFGVTANHELNQPLAIAMGFLGLLKSSMKEEQLTPENKEYFDRVDDSLQKMKNIIRKYADKKSKFHFGKYIKNSNIDMVVFDDNNSNLDQ